ncbi:MAG: hypothetical protein H6703_08615 [Myxococcales bacterium]|nr:hypothetical protein [Myxococcales bacterium]
MRRITLAALALTLAACADEAVDTTTPHLEPGDAIDLKSGQGTTYLLHVGGICSQSFTVGSKGENGARLGRFDGVQSVDLTIDQRESMATAVRQMVAHLDRYCAQDDCIVYTYSNGSAVISQTLATHADDRWNVLWVMQVASNEGGSEISDNFLAAPVTRLGFACPLADEIGPSDHRAGWNHNDTAGAIVYTLAGRDEWWYTGGFPDFFGGSANDGAVAYHSSGGLNDTYHISDDEPWLCYQPQYHYANHQPAFTCEGLDLDHNAMIMAGIDALGG